MIHYPSIILFAWLLIAAIPAQAGFKVEFLHQGSTETARTLEEVREAIEVDPHDWRLQTAVAMDSVYRAIEGDDSMVSPAREEMKRLMKLYPDHPLAEGFLALTYCLEARDTYLPWKAISGVGECQDRLNALVQRRPDHYPYRATRGQALAQLPQTFYDTYEVARADLQWVIDAYEDRDRYVNPKVYVDSLILLAQIEADEGHEIAAVRSLRKALGMALGRRDEAPIRGWLSELGVTDPVPILPPKPNVRRPASLAQARAKWEARLQKNPNDPEALGIAAQLDYFDAMAFDADASQRARQRLERAHELDPDNLSVETYLATAIGISADYAYYSHSAFALAALGLFRARQVEKKTGDRLGYILTGALGILYASTPNVLFHTREKANAYYRRIGDRQPDRETLKREVREIYGDEPWQHDTLLYLLRTMKSAGRRPIETRFVLALVMGLNPIAAPAESQRSRAEVAAILETRPEEAPQKRQRLDLWLGESLDRRPNALGAHD